MRVLVYCVSSTSGGAGSYLRNLAPLLNRVFERAANGYCLKFLAHEEQRGLLESVPESQCLWIKGKRLSGYKRVLWERREVPRIVRGEQIDVLFTPYQIGPRIPDVRHVLMLRNMEPFLCQAYRYSAKTWLRNRLLRRLSVRCLSQADRVIAVSGFARDQLLRGIGIDAARIREVTHGSPDRRSDMNDVQDRATLGTVGVEGDYIFTCGSLLPYRRCEDVIAAFNQYEPAQGSRAQLVIAGSGTDRRYGELIRRAVSASPHGERILVLGQVPWETMAVLYRQCSVFIMASEIEACPNIAIEAMSAGCAIVSANCPPLPEVFQGCSLEYRARDVDHLAERMRSAVEDANLRREMKARARQRAGAFSWEKCARETYAALTEWPNGQE
jgi:glycosyltransferase involved in cell wall biosynthesis